MLACLRRVEARGLSRTPRDPAPPSRCRRCCSCGPANCARRNGRGSTLTQQCGAGRGDEALESCATPPAARDGLSSRATAGSCKQSTTQRRHVRRPSIARAAGWPSSQSGGHLWSIQPTAARTYDMTHQIYPRSTRSAVAALATCFTIVLPVYAQQPSAPAASTAASSSANMGNKAAKPTVDALASQSGVATKKPAKAGAQSGPASGPAAADMPMKK